METQIVDMGDPMTDPWGWYKLPAFGEFLWLNLVKYTIHGWYDDMEPGLWQMLVIYQPS